MQPHILLAVERRKTPAHPPARPLARPPPGGRAGVHRWRSRCLSPCHRWSPSQLFLFVFLLLALLRPSHHHHHHTPYSCIISAFTCLTGSLSGNTVLPESQSEAACDERRRRPTSSPRGCRCAESTRRSTGPLKTECKLQVSGCVCVCVCRVVWPPLKTLSFPEKRVRKKRREQNPPQKNESLGCEVLRLPARDNV